MITAPLLTHFDGVRHTFGTRQDTGTDTVVAKQVHGNRFFFVTAPPDKALEGFDALLTDQKGISIGVTTADCLPILLAEPERKIVAAVHAGWRGTVARVVQETVAEMARRGGKVAAIRAALGPAIQGRCYEVGPDVFEAGREGFRRYFHPSEAGKWHLDIPGANQAQLLEMGVKFEKIDRIDLCTHCRPDLFHSYRRDGIGTGKMVSSIQLI